MCIKTSISNWFYGVVFIYFTIDLHIESQLIRREYIFCRYNVSDTWMHVFVLWKIYQQLYAYAEPWVQFANNINFEHCMRRLQVTVRFVLNPRQRDELSSCFSSILVYYTQESIYLPKLTDKCFTTMSHSECFDNRYRYYEFRSLSHWQLWHVQTDTTSSSNIRVKRWPSSFLKCSLQIVV